MAARIHAVQIAAYQQEAALLGVSDFPPLARTVEDIMGSRDLFFRAFDGEELLVSSVLNIKVMLKRLFPRLPLRRRFSGEGLAALLSQPLQSASRAPLLRCQPERRTIRLLPSLRSSALWLAGTSTSRRSSLRLLRFRQSVLTFGWRADALRARLNSDVRTLASLANETACHRWR